MSRYPHEITWADAWWGAPTAGEFSSYPPDQVPAAGARMLRNFLVDNPGRVVPRGSLGGPNAGDQGTLNDTTNGGQVLATLPYDDYVFLSYRAPAASAKIDSWRAPINRSLTASDIAQPSLGATAGRTVELNTGSTTNISTTDPNSVPGPRHARLGDAIYSPTFGGTATLVGGGSGYYAPNNLIHKNDLSSSVQLTNGPHYVQDVIGHAGCLWAAAASLTGFTDPVSGTAYDTAKVFYTKPNGTTAFTDVATDWQDPATGKTNFFTIGSSQDGDFNVGFGRAAGNLLVFKRNSVWIFYGTDPSNYELVQLRDQAGCVDARSIVITQEGTYFASQKGFELLSMGSSPKFDLLSQPIGDTWLTLSNGGVANNNINHGFIRANPLPNGYLYIAIGTDPFTANAADGTQAAWLFYKPTGAWVQMSTQISSMHLGAGGQFGRTLMTKNTVTAWGNTGYWTRGDFLTYGVDTLNGLAVRDRDGSSGVSLDLVIHSGIQNVGNRWNAVTFQRATTDFHQHFFNSSPTDGTAWATIVWEDSYRQVIVPSQNVPGFKASTNPTRVRPTYDCMQECPRGDIGFILESNIGSNTNLSNGELAFYGAGIQYQISRDRRQAVG